MHRTNEQFCCTEKKREYAKTDRQILQLLPKPKNLIQQKNIINVILCMRFTRIIHLDSLLYIVLYTRKKLILKHIKN